MHTQNTATLVLVMDLIRTLIYDNELFPLCLIHFSNTFFIIKVSIIISLSCIRTLFIRRNAVLTLNTMTLTQRYIVAFVKDIQFITRRKQRFLLHPRVM